MTIWYKKDINSQWTKFKDFTDYWDCINTLTILKTILGEQAIIKWF